MCVEQCKDQLWLASRHYNATITHHDSIQSYDLQNGKLACSQSWKDPAEERGLGVYFMRREALEEGTGHVEYL